VLRSRDEPTHRHVAAQLLEDLPPERALLALARLDLAAGEFPLPAALGMAVSPGDEDATSPADDRRDHLHLPHRRSTATSSPTLESR
jgi:hypothetical protein